MGVLKLCNWSAGIARADALAFAEKRQLAADVQLRRDLPAARSGAKGHAGVVDLSPDGRLNAMLAKLAKIDTLTIGATRLRRSTQQRQFHKAFTVAALPKLFGNELHKHLPRLMRQFDIDKMRSDVLVLAVRRAGKTMATSMFAAVWALTQPNTEICIYSTCQRTSRKLMILVKKLIVALHGGEGCIYAFNHEYLETTIPGGTCKINSLPSKVQISFFSHFSSFPSPPHFYSLFFRLFFPSFFLQFVSVCVCVRSGKKCNFFLALDRFLLFLAGSSLVFLGQPLALAVKCHIDNQIAHAQVRELPAQTRLVRTCSLDRTGVDRVVETGVTLGRAPDEFVRQLGKLNICRQVDPFQQRSCIVSGAHTRRKDTPFAFSACRFQTLTHIDGTCPTNPVLDISYHFNLRRAKRDALRRKCQ